MRIRWSREASDDIGRLHAFLLPLDPRAAARIAQMLIEMHYEVAADVISIIRVWHMREDR